MYSVKYRATMSKGLEPEIFTKEHVVHMVQ